MERKGNEFLSALWELLTQAISPSSHWPEGPQRRISFFYKRIWNIYPERLWLVLMKLLSGQFSRERRISNGGIWDTREGGLSVRDGVVSQHSTSHYSYHTSHAAYLVKPILRTYHVKQTLPFPTPKNPLVCLITLK